jgi:integrase
VRYPADPPTVKEIVAVMRHAADNRHGWRLRAMIVVLWRAGLRVQEALALAKHDLDPRADRFWFVAERAGGDARSGWTSGAGSSCAPGSACGRTSRRAAVLHH